MQGGLAALRKSRSPCILCLLSQRPVSAFSRPLRATATLTTQENGFKGAYAERSNARKPFNSSRSERRDERRTARRDEQRQKWKENEQNKDRRHPVSAVLRSSNNVALSPSKRVLRQLEQLQHTYYKDAAFGRLGMSRREMQLQYEDLADEVQDAVSSNLSPLGRTLRRYANINDSRVAIELKYMLYARCLSKDIAKADEQKLGSKVDLRHPTEWYPTARAFTREWHLHVGPTNSGKTYHALKRLEQAESGIYCGPLRLLAHEVYMRMNAKGIACDLVTGDEQKKMTPEGAPTMISSTVEMVPLGIDVDVAVVDEIQMIGDEDRGWAWTQAVLGLRAKELHLCGEERTVKLIQDLGAACGETVHVHRYTRLSPLQMSAESLNGNLNNLKKGDCIVAFSIFLIHTLRQLIEKQTRKKCAIIYGSLPPDTRAQQAALFNDPDNDYDFLVASNAVGMGLNLSIKRLVFQSVRRKVGTKVETLPVPEIKQIAGRAGRYRTAPSSITPATSETPAMTADKGALAEKQKQASAGFVTTLEAGDLQIVRQALENEPVPMTRAGIAPPSFVIEEFARHFPDGTPFGYILIKLAEHSTLTTQMFHLCDIRSQVGIADAIEDVRDLTVADRLVFCSAPIEVRKEGEPELARSYARCVAACQEVTILDFDEIDWSLLDELNKVDRLYLARLERLHKAVIIYLWLSYRFVGIFKERYVAEHIKSIVERRIESTLAQLAFDYKKLSRSRSRSLWDLLGGEPAEDDAVRDTEQQDDAKKMSVGILLDEMAQQDPEFRRMRKDATADIDESSVEADQLDSSQSAYHLRVSQ